MRISRTGQKKTVIGGALLAAVCAAAIPAAAAHAGTQATGRTVSTQAAHTVNPMNTNGCASGTVCMYTSSGWSHGTTEHHWWQYGCYNLVNEYGTRYVFNNQTGGAGTKLWTGKNCTKTGKPVSAGYTWEGDITPINSISLYP